MGGTRCRLVQYRMMRRLGELDLIPARALIQNTWSTVDSLKLKRGTAVVCWVFGLARQARAPSTEQRRNWELKVGGA